MQNLATTELPQTIKNMDMVLVADWNKYFLYPNTGSLRQMIFFNKDNIKKCVVKMGGRLYIKVSEFFKWIEETNRKETV